VLITTKETIMASSFFSFSIDEIIIINNQSWISIHYYMVVALKCVYVLFTFQWMVKGGTTTNIKAIIFFTLMKFGGLFKSKILKHIMWQGVNGALTFQGLDLELMF
jgi:hypothetical protein